MGRDGEWGREMENDIGKDREWRREMGNDLGRDGEWRREMGNNLGREYRQLDAPNGSHLAPGRADSFYPSMHFYMMAIEDL